MISNLRMAVNKKTKDTSIDDDMEKEELSCTMLGMQIGTVIIEILGKLLKVKNRTTIRSSNSTSECVVKRIERRHSCMFYNCTILNSQKVAATQVFLDERLKQNVKLYIHTTK